MTALAQLFADMAVRIERLESHVRRHEKVLVELSKDSGVYNRKVELILDQQQTNSFLKEEDQDERARSAHPSVQSVSQANAQASKVV